MIEATGVRHHCDTLSWGRHAGYWPSALCDCLKAGFTLPVSLSTNNGTTRQCGKELITVVPFDMGCFRSNYVEDTGSAGQAKQRRADENGNPATLAESAVAPPAHPSSDEKRQPPAHSAVMIITRASSVIAAAIWL